jgi:hypothetical protein
MGKWFRQRQFLLGDSQQDLVARDDDRVERQDADSAGGQRIEQDEEPGDAVTDRQLVVGE